MTNTPTNENGSHHDEEKNSTNSYQGTTDTDVAETVTHEVLHVTQGERRGFFDLIYGTLFNPSATFRAIAGEPPVFYGFLIFMSVVVITSLVNIILPQDMGEMPPELAEVLAQAGPSLVIVGAIVSTLFWFIQAGILQVIAELMGGRGKAVGVLTVLALAGIPSVLAVPFRVLGYFLGDSFVGSFLTIVGSLLVFVWWVVLLVLGLREVHQISTGKAIAVIISPFAGLMLMLIVTIISLFAFIAPLLSNIQ